MIYDIDGTSYEVVIVKKNNKNTYLRVKDDLKIYITTNYFTTKFDIKRLLDNNSENIKKMISDKVKKNDYDKYFHYLGNRYEVFIDDVDGVKFLDDAIYVSSMEFFNKWLKKEIKRLFSCRLDYNYSIFKENIPYPKLKIRSMTTRWGVCNKKDNSVTLNSKLIEFDVDKLDYVIIHELSHFIHFNHSKDFWNLVSEYVPNYKEIRKEMRE